MPPGNDAGNSLGNDGQSNQSSLTDIRAEGRPSCGSGSIVSHSTPDSAPAVLVSLDRFAGPIGDGSQRPSPARGRPCEPSSLSAYPSECPPAPLVSRRCLRPARLRCPSPSSYERSGSTPSPSSPCSGARASGSSQSPSALTTCRRVSSWRGSSPAPICGGRRPGPGLRQSRQRRERTGSGRSLNRRLPIPATPALRPSASPTQQGVIR